MSRLFTAANNQRFEADIVPVSDWPLTLSAWVRNVDASPGSDCIIQFGSTGAPYLRLGIGDGATPDPYRIRHSSGDEAYGTGDAVQNQWDSVVGIATSTTMECWRNGVSNTGDTHAVNFGTSGFTRTAIGYENDGSPGDPWNGNLFWVAVHSVAFSEEEAIQHSNGVPPWLIQPGALEMLVTLDGGTGNVIDLISGTVFTETVDAGSIAHSDLNPPITMPRETIWLPPSVTATPAPIYRRKHVGFIHG